MVADEHRLPDSMVGSKAAGRVGEDDGFGAGGCTRSGWGGPRRISRAPRRRESGPTAPGLDGCRSGWTARAPLMAERGRCGKPGSSAMGMTAAGSPGFGRGLQNRNRGPPRRRVCGRLSVRRSSRLRSRRLGSPRRPTPRMPYCQDADRHSVEPHRAGAPMTLADVTRILAGFPLRRPCCLRASSSFTTILNSAVRNSPPPSSWPIVSSGGPQPEGIARRNRLTCDFGPDHAPRIALRADMDALPMPDLSGRRTRRSCPGGSCMRP